MSAISLLPLIEAGSDGAVHLPLLRSAAMWRFIFVFSGRQRCGGSSSSSPVDSNLRVRRDNGNKKS
jgi:hypothetical protein